MTTPPKQPCAAHAWGPWTERPAEMPIRRRTDVRRWRWCTLCITYDAEYGA